MHGGIMRQFAHLNDHVPPSVLLIRIALGGIFLSEGLQKFLFSEQLGVGRFAKIGIPFPEILAPFVATFEITCGLLVLIGLLTRIASLPLATIMCVAIATTKIPLLAKSGFWVMAHESRTDFALLLSSTFLLLNGAGKYSLDAIIARKRWSSGQRLAGR